MPELSKAYEPAAIEARWAEYWVKERLFEVPTPRPGDTRPVFTLLLPPPNVTGRLHMGHMLNQTQMDIIIRWRRMRGEVTLWLVEPVAPPLSVTVSVTVYVPPVP